MSSSHHSGRGPLSEEERELLEQDQGALERRFAEQLAGTARPVFPRGKLNEHDEGALVLRVAAAQDRGVVLIDFGKPVASLGVPKPEALALAEMIRKHAELLWDGER